MLERRLAHQAPLYSPESVEGDRDTDRMQPRGKGRVVPKFADPLERANEGELSEVTSELILAGEAVRQPVHAIDMGVVELPLRTRLSGDYPRDQLSFVHPVCCPLRSQERRHRKLRHRTLSKGSVDPVPAASYPLRVAGLKRRITRKRSDDDTSIAAEDRNSVRVAVVINQITTIDASTGTIGPPGILNGIAPSLRTSRL